MTTHTYGKEEELPDIEIDGHDDDGLPNLPEFEKKTSPVVKKKKLLEASLLLL